MCTHAAIDGMPLLAARRDEPVVAVDSGWQLHCDRFDHEREEDATIVCLGCVAQRWPDVAPFLDREAPIGIVRSSAKAKWREFVPEPLPEE